MGFDITDFSGAVPDMPDNCTVDFYNNSASTIGEFSPVALTGAYGEAGWQLNRYCGNAVFNAQAAVDDALPWGISLGEVRVGEFGRAVISGTAPAYFSGNGKFVAPVGGGLTANESGNARILLAPLELNSKHSLPGIILLGSSAVSAAPAEEYHGIFKLQALSPDTVMIINGADPSSAYCGATDVPGLKLIPTAVVTLDSVSEWQIFLAFFYDRTSGTYSAQFVTALPGNCVFSQLLGSFKSGTVNQIYKVDVSRMTFGEEWYLS